MFRSARWPNPGVDCEEAVPAGTPGANRELAKDLASRTVDGGVLVIGVKDEAATAEDVRGVADDVEGLKSPITQMAAEAGRDVIADGGALAIGSPVAVVRGLRFCAISRSGRSRAVSASCHAFGPDWMTSIRLWRFSVTGSMPS